MTVTADEFREAMARLPAPVAILTTIDGHGAPYGFTASSVCSVSVHPPLLLVCLDQDMRCHDAFIEGEEFRVSVLGEGHADLALLFATRGANKFADPRLVWPQVGAPVVADAAALIDCRRYARHDAGDHTILVGEVTSTSLAERKPLTHVSRGFSVAVPLST